jgi:hypothetical protein
MTQIPKVIHYCWFGHKKLPILEEKCFLSWKKHLPDYEIIRWDESNININENFYIKEAYDLKKYAFVSDYIRFKILFEYGGIYIDTDVEVLRSLDILLLNEAFMGFECIDKIGPGLIIGAKKNNNLIYEILKSYYNNKFIINNVINTQTVVERVTNILLKKGLILNGNFQIISGMTIYPIDYFSPKSYITNKINITSNTFSIHHYSGSWVPKYRKFEKFFWNTFNLPNYDFISQIIYKTKKLINIIYNV